MIIPKKNSRYRINFFWLMTAAAFCRPTGPFGESWARSPLIDPYEKLRLKGYTGYLGYLFAKGERSNPYIKEVIK